MSFPSGRDQGRGSIVAGRPRPIHRRPSRGRCRVRPRWETALSSSPCAPVTLVVPRRTRPSPSLRSSRGIADNSIAHVSFFRRRTRACDAASALCIASISALVTEPVTARRRRSKTSSRKRMLDLSRLTTENVCTRNVREDDMCRDASLCGAPGEDVSLPKVRRVQCHVTSSNRCVSGHRNGLLA